LGADYEVEGGRYRFVRVYPGENWNPDGTWDVENRGVAPDIEVELDPKAWREGRDLQLEKAVEVALEELRANPLPTHTKPAYPNYHKGK
jgi:tricorn protease